MLLVLLTVGVLGPGLWWAGQLNAVRAHYAAECPVPPKLVDDWSVAKSSMKEQSALLLSWALAATGGVIAIIITATVHSFRVIRLLYLLLAPALSLLSGSMWAAVLFQRRVTFLELNHCSVGGTANDLLLEQGSLLQYAVSILALFAIACLAQIVTGLVDPTRHGQ